MVTMLQSPRRARAGLAWAIAAVAAAVTVAVAAWSPTASALAAARSPLAQAGHLPGRSEPAWRGLPISAWLARLGRHRAFHLRTGGCPSYIGLDPADGAMYVPDNVDAAVSVFRLPS